MKLLQARCIARTEEVGVEGCFNDFSDTISGRLIGPLSRDFLSSEGAKASRYSRTKSLPVGSWGGIPKRRPWEPIFKPREA